MTHNDDAVYGVESNVTDWVHFYVAFPDQPHRANRQENFAKCHVRKSCGRI